MITCVAGLKVCRVFGPHGRQEVSGIKSVGPRHWLHLSRFATHAVTFLLFFVGSATLERLFADEHAPAIDRLAMAQLPPAEETDEVESRPFYVPLNLTFADIDLQQLAQRLSSFGIEIPFELSGQASTTIRGRIPLGQLADAGAYEFTGTISSPQLTIAGVELRDLDAELTYEQGVLMLNSLQFAVPPEDAAHADAIAAALGRITGEARMALVPRGDLIMSLEFEDVPLDQFAELAPELQEASSGEVSGQISASVPVNELRDVEAWIARGNAAVANLQLYDAPPLHTRVAFRLAHGELILPDVAGQLEQSSLAGSGRVELKAPFAFETELRLSVENLSLIERLNEDLRIPLELAGASQLTSVAEGTLVPLVLEAGGTGSGENLELSGAIIDNMTFEYVTDGETLLLSDIQAALYEGTAGGRATLPLRAADGGTASIIWRSVAAGELLEDVGTLPFPVALTSSGRLDGIIPPGELDDPLAWELDFATSVADAAVFGWTAERGTARGSLREGAILVEELQLERGATRLQASGRFSLRGGQPFALSLDLVNADLGRWNSLPDAYHAPVTLAGRYSVVGDFQGELATSQLTGSGRVTLADALIEQLRLDAAELDFDVLEDEVVVRDAVALLYGGRVDGAGRVPLAADRSGEADIVWSNVRAGRLLESLQLLPASVRGGVSSGEATLDIPAGQLGNLARWSGSSALTLRNLAVGDVRVTDLIAAAKLQENRLRIEQLVGNLMQGQLQLSGEVAVREPYNYAVQAELLSVNIESLNGLPDQLKLPVEVAGLVSASADLQGTLQPLQANGTGEVAADHVLLGDSFIDAIDLDFVIDDQALQVPNIELALYTGSASGSATLPLEEDVEGQAAIQWVGVDLGDWAENQFPAWTADVALTAPTSGELSAAIPAGGLDDLFEWQVQGALAVPMLEANNTAIGSLEAQVEVVRGVLSYEATGSLLDGALEAAGSTALQDPTAEGIALPPPSQPAELPARFQLRGLQLARLSAVFPDLQLAGTLSASLAVPAATDVPRATGTVIAEDLRWDRILLSSRLQGRLLLDSGLLLLQDFGGDYADGRLRAAATVDLNALDRSLFEISLVGGEVNEALAAWPDVAEYFSGVADLQMRGSLGRPVRARGMATLRRGEIAALGVTGIRVPFSLSFDPLTGESRVEVRDTSAQLARGRVTGSWQLGWRRGLYVDGQWRFADVDMPELVRQFSSTSRFGQGRLTGTLTLSGTNVQSVDDLQGRLVASLRNTQALAMPVLQQVQPYLSRGVTGTTRFDQGEIEATLRRGVINIQELSLVSDTAQLFATGRVTTAGRLDLQVTASTSQLAQSRLIAQPLLRQVTAAAAPPVSLLLTASQFLQDRVIHLHVTGTVRSPTIRIRPLPTLQEEAVRFFLQQAVGG